jgi:glycerol-3-phosphate dehydrogenase
VGEITSEERQAFYQKIAMIGYGAYGSALHSRLKEFDILPWARKLAERGDDARITDDLNTALDGRGILMLAVPSNAFPTVLDSIRPHKESVVMSLAKGLIVPGWNPLASERALREGPQEGARALTPTELIAEHKNWKHVADNVVFVGGPGFAKDVRDGGYLGLTLAGRRSRAGATDAVAKSFFILSGMSGDKNIEIFDNPVALEIAASMKNVAAFAAGVMLGVLRNHGALESAKDGSYRITKRVEVKHGGHSVVLDAQSLHRLVHAAAKEIVNIVKSEGGNGPKTTSLMMAGSHDLNLTVHSLTSRNVQAGMRLACGENIFDILTTRDSNGHLLTAEGVSASHAMARRIQNNADSEAHAPLVFSMRNILLGRGQPEAIIAQYFGQLNKWSEADALAILNGKSKPLGLRVHSSSAHGLPHSN